MPELPVIETISGTRRLDRPHPPLDGAPLDAGPPLDGAPLDVAPLVTRGALGAGLTRNSPAFDPLSLDALPLYLLRPDTLPLGPLGLDAPPLDPLRLDALPLGSLGLDSLSLDSLRPDALCDPRTTLGCAGRRTNLLCNSGCAPLSLDTLALLWSLGPSSRACLPARLNGADPFARLRPLGADCPLTAFGRLRTGLGALCALFAPIGFLGAFPSLRAAITALRVGRCGDRERRDGGDQKCLSHAKFQLACFIRHIAKNRVITG
ncbi:MAG: hypothetical protein WKF52_03060 [Sphingomicrobium sp.]